MSVHVLESPIRRHGRPFEPLHEVELRDDLIRVSRTLAQSSGLGFVILEMPGPMGVPDALVMRASPRALQARLDADVEPILDQYACELLTMLRQVRGDTHSAQTCLGWTDYTMRSALARLRSAGAVVLTVRGRVHPKPGLQPIGKSIAVEAKVRDWKRALGQGRVYASWADSYQLLLGHVADSAVLALASMVAGDQAGLVIGQKWVVRPKLPSGTGSLVASEHFLAAFLATNLPKP